MHYQSIRHDRDEFGVNLILMFLKVLDETYSAQYNQRIPKACLPVSVCRIQLARQPVWDLGAA